MSLPCALILSFLNVCVLASGQEEHRSRNLRYAAIGTGIGLAIVAVVDLVALAFLSQSTRQKLLGVYQQKGEESQSEAVPDEIHWTPVEPCKIGSNDLQDSSARWAHRNTVSPSSLSVNTSENHSEIPVRSDITQSCNEVLLTDLEDQSDHYCDHLVLQESVPQDIVLIVSDGSPARSPQAPQHNMLIVPDSGAAALTGTPKHLSKERSHVSLKSSVSASSLAFIDQLIRGSGHQVLINALEPQDLENQAMAQLPGRCPSSASVLR